MKRLVVHGECVFHFSTVVAPPYIQDDPNRKQLGSAV